MPCPYRGGGPVTVVQSLKVLHVRWHVAAGQLPHPKGMVPGMSPRLEGLYSPRTRRFALPARSSTHRHEFREERARHVAQKRQPGECVTLPGRRRHLRLLTISRHEMAEHGMAEMVRPLIAGTFHDANNASQYPEPAETSKRVFPTAPPATFTAPSGEMVV